MGPIQTPARLQPLLSIKHHNLWGVAYLDLVWKFLLQMPLPSCAVVPGLQLQVTLVSHTQVIVSSKGMLRTTVKIIYIYPSELDVYVSSNPLLNEVFILKDRLPIFTPGRWGPPRLRVWIYILYNYVPQGEQCPGLCICSLQICPLCLNHFHLYADFYSPLSPDVLLFILSLHTVHPAHCCQIVFQLSFHYIPLKTFFASS